MSFLRRGREKTPPPTALSRVRSTPTTPTPPTARGFFASDNGAHSEGGHAIAFFDSTGGLPGHKGGMYEASVRSPSMVRWPTWIAENQTSELPWAFWDVFPTVAQWPGGRQRV